MKSLKVLLILQVLLCLFHIQAANVSDLTIYSNNTESIKKLFASTSDKARAVQDKVSPFDIKGQLEVSQKDFSDFPAGTTIYFKFDELATELIVCQRANDSTWLNQTATKIFQENSLAVRFAFKSFLAKTATESCRGHIYYLSEDAASVNAIRKFANQIPRQNLPFDLEAALKHATNQTISHIKIQVDSTVKFTYRLYNVPLTFLSQSVQWEKTPSNSSSSITVKNGNTSTKISFAANTRAQTTPQVSALTTKVGKGLHQKLIKELFVENKGKRVNFGSKGDCQILLVDPLTDQTYVDQDEVRYNAHFELKRFEVLDIEKPQVTAKQLLWMIRVNVSDLTRISGKNDELKVEYLAHFRYRDADVQPYVNSQLFLRTTFFSNCPELSAVAQEDITTNEFYADKVRQWYGSEYKQAPLRHYLSVQDYQQGRSANVIEEKIPVGDLTIKNFVTVVSLGISVVGALILFVFIAKSPKTKVA